MKLTTLLLLLSLVQVSAATFGQEFTLTDKSVSIEKVLREIRKQTGYNILVESSRLNTSAKVSVNFVKTPLPTVMQTLLKGTEMTFELEDRSIVLKPRETSFVDRVAQKLEAIDVTGRILDENGTPFAGASITLKGTSQKTVSADNGTFLLKGVPAGAMIEITIVGYKPVTIAAAKNLGDIRMQQLVGKLQDVQIVNTGYATLPKERSAGSFSVVNMDVVANRTTSMNILQSLDGQVPGLVVNNAPLKNQLLIRGLSTVGGAGNFPGGTTTAQPLYVIDGLAVPTTNDYDKLPDIILNLNPQDVESVTVLKDATAASIWGARAANGVIIIKTKSGKFNSKLRFNYNGFVNFQGKPELDYVPTLSSQQYVQTGIELFNENHTPWATISALKGGGIPPLELILYNQERGVITPAQASAQLDALANQDNRQQIKDLFYRNAMLSNQTVSMSGGSDNYAFYGSASYTNTLSNVPGESNKTYKINFSQDIKATRFLSIHLLTDISNNTASAKRNYSVDYFSAPYVMYRDASGKNMAIPYLTGETEENLKAMEDRAKVSLAYSPLDEFNNGSTKSDGLLARLNGGVKVNLFKGLRFEGTYGYIKGANKTRDFESLQSFTVRKEIAQFTVNASPTTTPKYYLPINGGRLTNVNGSQHKWDIRNQLLYETAFGKNEVTVLAGQEAQESFGTSTQTRVRGFDESLLTSGSIDWATIASPILNTVWPTISTLASSLANDSFSTNETTTRYTSYYANGAYTFDHRYTLNASWRNDQSNLFGKQKSAQNKPIWSLGGKWNVGNEQFFKPVKWVDNLALRATYGIMGNSPNVGVAASQDIVGPSGSAFFPGGIGLQILTPGNPKLSWERTAMYNVGVDFSVFTSRLSGTIDFYRKHTTDLIGLVYPNSLTGYVSMVGNQGTMQNNGIEMDLSSANIRGRNFSWSTDFIFAYNKNKLVKLNLSTPVTTGAQQVASQVQEGRPVFAVFAYQYAGLSSTGAPLIRLSDGSTSAVRNVSKPEDIVYLGTNQPVWNGGLTNTFQYRNFRLAANMVYNMGHVMRRDRYVTINRPMTSNVSVDFLNRWRVPGDEANTDIPGLVNSTANDFNYFAQGDGNVVNASFLKLRDITLFYQLPKALTTRLKAQGISFRAQVSNVMLWKANHYGIDPEFQGLPVRTNQNTVSLGANLSF